MRVHHLNCGTLCTAAPALIGGGAQVCHCLLIEAPNGLVLVDTGVGLADVRAPVERLGRGFLALSRPALQEAKTAVRQVEALGFSAGDVRHIVVTHLDLDHAGGLSDFPFAKVHISMQEHEGAMLSTTLRDRLRYRPQQWAHWPDFELYRTRGERWFGFDAIGQLRGLPPEILLVPLFGHTRGHCGVAVQTTDTRSAAGWLFHAGDAYYHRDTVAFSDPARGPRAEPARAPLAIRLFEAAMDQDRAARIANQARLRGMAAGGEVELFCAHDPVELSRYT